MTKNKIPIRISFPTVFKEVDLKNSSIREIIKENDGKLALIVDEHYFFKGEQILTRIKYDPNDKQCYYVQLPMSDKTLKNFRLQYHDLQRLFITTQEINSVYWDFNEELYLSPIGEQISKLEKVESQLNKKYK